MDNAISMCIVKIKHTIQDISLAPNVIPNDIPRCHKKFYEERKMNA